MPASQFQPGYTNHWPGGPSAESLARAISRWLLKLDPKYTLHKCSSRREESNGVKFIHVESTVKKLLAIIFENPHFCLLSVGGPGYMSVGFKERGLKVVPLYS